MTTEYVIPRRNRIDRFSRAERAIWDAAQAVEAMPADPRLTEAGELLSKARGLVADFVDERPEVPGLGPSPECIAEIEAMERQNAANVAKLLGRGLLSD